MIECIMADVRSYGEGVTDSKKKARLVINIYGDDESELQTFGIEAQFILPGMHKLSFEMETVGGGDLLQNNSFKTYFFKYINVIKIKFLHCYSSVTQYISFLLTT